jgi:PAS domain S-box-containing protein
MGFWGADLRCRFANPAYLYWFGKSAEQIQGMLMPEVMGPESFAIAEPFVRAALAGEPQTYERPMQTAAGEIVHVWVQYIPAYGAQGGVVGFYVLATDVTALKQTQERLERANAELSRARETAEAASRAKADFLAHMSHEIRTPLNGVLGMAQVMAAGKLSSEQRRRLDVIRGSGDAVLTILNDVLDLAKVEAGKLELESAPFLVDRLLCEASGVFQGLADQKQLRLETTCAVEDAYVGDAARLRQILYNLLSNALKFTQRGAVRLEAAVEGAELLLTVSDTGGGIAPDDLARLFDRFAQADTTISRRFGGTGLGLAIARELAQLMGGDITVISAPGAGSTFTVRLPLAKAGRAEADRLRAAASGVPAARGARFGPGLRVLAAEDNAINRRVLDALLEQTGLDVVFAEDGEQVVEAWRTGEWHLILMDIRMPRMDGVAATRMIREAEARDGRRRTPILALTADAMAHQRDQYLALGMDGFVAKPLSATLLMQAVAMAVGEAPAPGVFDKAPSGR